ncbi:MAG: flagellar biosynthesis anti-sigma factor FlgM [Burkholderiaceae bacterium]
MKINNLNESLRSERAPSAGGKPLATTTSAPAASGSKVELSDLAARLTQLETQFADSDFNAKKVDEIRSAIAEGRFQVNAGTVADKLLTSVDELLGRKG